MIVSQRWRLLLEEYVPTYVHITLSRLEKDEDEDEKLSQTEEGLVLSHAMYAVEQNEARIMPETKEELVRNIMNVDEMESEEFPMSPEIIDREQKRHTLKISDEEIRQILRETCRKIYSDHL
jgi:hypothetical protein